MAARRSLTLFGIAQFLLEVQFWLPLWLIFLLDQGISLPMAMAADALFRLVVVGAEVPTGLVADRLGRRRTYCFSALLSMLAFTLVAAVDSPPSLMLAWVVWGIAWAFNSGASASYLYELAGSQGRDPLRVFSVIRATGQLAILISLLSAGALYEVDARAPFAVTAVLAGVAALVILFLPEVEPGLRVSLRSVAPSLAAKPLRTAILLAVVVLGFGWSVQVLYQPIALELALDANRTSLMYAGLAVAGIGGAVAAGRIRRTDAPVAGVGLCVVGAVGGSAHLAWAPFVWLPLCSFGFVMAWTSIEVILARLAPTVVRATVYAVVSMIAGLWIAAARPALGISSAEVGSATTLAWWAVIGLAACAATVLLSRRLSFPTD